MRKFKFCQFLLPLLMFALTMPVFGQNCFPIGFQVDNTTWAINTAVDLKMCVLGAQTTLDVPMDSVMAITFDGDLGTVTSVGTPVVHHSTVVTGVSDPITSSDFDGSIGPSNNHKLRITYNQSSTHHMTTGDTVCVDFQFTTAGSPVTAPITFITNINGMVTGTPPQTTATIL